MDTRLDWRPLAAYVYLLHLDGPALAWEYLRRNTHYQVDWHNGASKTAERWGLTCLENPAGDARYAEPAWLVESDDITRLTADRAPVARQARFTLWGTPGHKSLLHDGRRLLLTNALGHDQLRITLDDSIRDDVPVGYLIRSDASVSSQYRAIERQRRLWTENALIGQAHPRPERNALVHMRCLQAIDGADAGASHRIIATMLFGNDAVDARWDSDGDLRNQIRFLVRRARRYVGGDYLRLLSAIRPSRKGEKPMDPNHPEHARPVR
jgi:hypothetical protein